MGKKSSLSPPLNKGSRWDYFTFPRREVRVIERVNYCITNIPWRPHLIKKERKP
jgi:hypothetical protein